MTDLSTVRPHGAADLDAVVAVLVDAFASYPVMRFVVGTSSESADHLTDLFRFFVMARILRHEPVFGLGPASELSGVALVSDPRVVSPPELSAVREQTWRTLGAEARKRYEAYGTAAASVLVDRPRLHLNLLGVRSRDRGRGVSRRLLEEVHRYARGHPTAEGVSLTTENPHNVGLYEHFGYQLTGEAPVADGVVTWGMFRSN